MIKLIKPQHKYAGCQSCASENTLQLVVGVDEQHTNSIHVCLKCLESVVNSEYRDKYHELVKKYDNLIDQYLELNSER